MTQQPPPYNMPPTSTPYGYGPYGGDPYANLLAPAKRASILMFVLGGIGLLCGVCAGVMTEMLKPGRLPPEAAARFAELEAQMGMSVSTILLILAIASAVPGIVSIILGIFVRRGSMGAIITSLVLTSLAVLWGLYNLISTLLHAGQDPEAAIGVCMVVVNEGLLVLLLVWLIQAARAVPQARRMQAEYEAQYWQYQQQQQMYQQQQQQPQPGMYGATGQEQYPQTPLPPPQQQDRQELPPPPPQG